MKEKKPCTTTTVMHGTFARGSTLLALIQSIKASCFCYNVATGPDWGHSELVFICFPQGYLQHRILRYIPL